MSLWFVYLECVFVFADIVEFDNSYSMLRGKSLSYCVEVIEGTSEGIQSEESQRADESAAHYDS